MIVQLPADEIALPLIRRGVPASAIYLADAFYALFTKKDVHERLAPALTGVINGLNFTYQPDRRDCDDFARLAAAWAGLLHSQQKVEDCGVAFGEVWCDAIAHAFCFAIHGVEREVVFYEPQLVGAFSLSEISLGRRECESIRLIKV